MSELNKGEIDFLVGFLTSNITKVNAVKKNEEVDEHTLIELDIVTEISAEIIFKLKEQKEILSLR